MSAARRPFSGGSWLDPAPTLLLSASSNGRYLVDDQGNPFQIRGEAAWSLFAQLSLTDATTYLEDCRTRGINAVMANAVEHFYSDNAPNNVDGDFPWTTTAFQSSLNTTYWGKVDDIIEVANAKGIVVFLSIAYWGFSGEEGWDTEIIAASAGQLQTYGANVGTRLKDHNNIVYHDFNDNGPEVSSIDADMADIHTGLISTDTRHTLFSNHYFPDTSAHSSYRSYATYDFVYLGGASSSTYSAITDGWNSTNNGHAVPVLLGEGEYEGSGGGDDATASDVERQAWQARLSGACGEFSGHTDIWKFNKTGTPDAWVSALTATGRTRLTHLKTFFAARAWHLLAPDTGDTFVTSAKGSGTTRKAAAFATDSSWGAFMVSNGSSGGATTVAHTKFSGSFTWTWYNPRTGGTSGGASGVANSGTGNYTAPDTNSWVWVGRVGGTA